MTTEESILGKECRFAIHIRSQSPDDPDLHLVKEVIHYADGTTKPNLCFVKDFKRPFWVTKPTARKHKEKLEWERENVLFKREVTQSALRQEVAKALNMSWSNSQLRELSVSPYLYGSDLPSTSWLKRKYQERSPQLSTAFSLCTLDIETDVVYGDGSEPIMVSTAFKNQVHLYVSAQWLGDVPDAQGRFDLVVKKYLNEEVVTKNCKVSLYVCENALEALLQCFKQIHAWMPDWLAIWNVDFDIPKIMTYLERCGVNPASVLCDPMVPEHLRICRYKQGPKKKITSSGRVTPIAPAAQWHTLHLTASFYVIDAMCAYKHLRLGDPEEPSYSLDAILTKRLKRGKLAFTQADNYHKLKWHQFMQSNYKFEYMVYNVWDSLSMLRLDEETKDLAYALPGFSGVTNFDMFRSQPARIISSFYFYLLEKGYVLATLPPRDDKAKEELDEEAGDSGDEDEEDEDKTLGLDGWIITLAPHLSVLGLPLIQENPHQYTGIRAFTYDMDSVSSYPTCTSIANVSKSTTRKELISIEGVDEQLFRKQNLNFVLGQVNAIEYNVEMFGMAKPKGLLAYALQNPQFTHIE